MKSESNRHAGSPAAKTAHRRSALDEPVPSPPTTSEPRRPSASSVRRPREIAEPTSDPAVPRASSTRNGRESQASSTNGASVDRASAHGDTVYAGLKSVDAAAPRRERGSDLGGVRPMSPFDEVQNRGFVPPARPHVTEEPASAANETAPAEGTAPPQAPELAPTRTLRDELVQYATRLEKELIEAADAPPDEAVLAKLASGEMATALELQTLQAHLARRATLCVDDATVLTLVRVLREMAPALTATTKRVCMTLSTASSLRAQRRFLQLNARRDDER
jgi:hypothetical protein